MSTPHIVIAGGGYVGMYTALGLQKKLRRGEARVTVIDPRSAMTYQPFLPEAAAGSLEPRHVVVPLRKVLKRCDVITARVMSVDHAHQTLRVEPPQGEPYDLTYDEIVVAMGSVARTLPIPGLREHGMGFRQIEEAIALRNHVLDRLDLATSVLDPATRSCALTFVFVGGGYAGVEALAEIEDMARFATRYYDTIGESDLRFVLVEATGRILPEVGVDMGAYTVQELVRRGMDIRLNTRVDSMVGGHVVLSDGDEYDCDTIVWTAGVKANPVLTETDLPLDDKGRLRCTAELQVRGVADAWGAGDCAAVPDLSSKDPDATCGPSAQHAVRQARHLGDNIARVIQGGRATPYKHKYVGSVASLGLYKGVAQVYGVKVKGFPAWFLHRTYHMSRIPTLNRKVRVLADWTLAFLFRRDVISLGQLQHPRAQFERAAR